MNVFRTIHNGKLERFEHADPSALYFIVVRFYRENNINFEDADLKRQIARQSGKGAVKPSRLSLKDVAKGSLVVIKNMAGKSTTSAEILRRSAICASCPLMSLISGCSACGAGKAMSNFANKIRASKGSQIPIPPTVSQNYCGFCECALATIVTTRKEDFYEEDPAKNSMRPDICFLKTTSVNYSHE